MRKVHEAHNHQREKWWEAVMCRVVYTRYHFIIGDTESVLSGTTSLFPSTPAAFLRFVVLYLFPYYPQVCHYRRSVYPIPAGQQSLTAWGVWVGATTINSGYPHHINHPQKDVNNSEMLYSVEVSGASLLPDTRKGIKKCAIETGCCSNGGT